MVCMTLFRIQHLSKNGESREKKIIKVGCLFPIFLEGKRQILSLTGRKNPEQCTLKGCKRLCQFT